GLSERILARDAQSGVATRMLRFIPGADTSAFGVVVHDFWEEVYILEGSLHDLSLNQSFPAGTYACRPPGMKHGPWRAPEGCVTGSARTEAAVRAAGRFGISFLREEQGELSNRFARRGEDHFAGLELRYEGGVPLLPGTLGYLVCETVETYVQGDHSIVVAQVVRAAAEAGRPLPFFGGNFPGFGGLDW